MRSLRTGVCFLTVLAIGALSGHAQTVADSISRALDADRLKTYRTERLSVVIETRTERTVDVTGERYYDIFGRPAGRDVSVVKSGDTYKSWKPYRGFERIPEPKFFEIAGYPEQARKARAFHTTEYQPAWANIAGVGMIGVSGPAFILGGAGLIAAETPEDRSPDKTATIAGAVGVVIGALILSVDKEGYDPGPPMWAPASQVHGIAGEYNRRLYRKLKKLRGAATENRPSAVRLPASTSAVAPDVRKALSLPTGAKKVRSSEAGSLQEGDVIISVDGMRLEQEGSLKKAIKRHTPGDTVQLEILREGQSKTVSVTLRESIGG